MKAARAGPRAEAVLLEEEDDSSAAGGAAQAVAADTAAGETEGGELDASGLKPEVVCKGLKGGSPEAMATQASQGSIMLQPLPPKCRGRASGRKNLERPPLAWA